jgi:hypothetical protein
MTTYTLTHPYCGKIISVTFTLFVDMDNTVEITNDADHEIRFHRGIDAQGETFWRLPTGMILRYTHHARTIWNTMIAAGWEVSS